MREIKFRGVTHELSSPSWIYGDLICNSTDAPRIMDDYHDCYEPTTWLVDPETVGQFTGLKDCKGREIYEGDIVKVVSYGEESFHVVKYMIDLDYPAFDLEPALDGDFNSLGYCLIDIDTKITVIGNIYDNPELLRLTKTGGFEK